MKSTYDSLEDIIVFDDVISLAYQDWLLKKVDSPSFNWRRSDQAVNTSAKFFGDTRNGFMNTCPIFVGNFNLITFEEESRENNFHHPDGLLNCFFPLLLEFAEPLGVKSLKRMRINAIPAMGNNDIRFPHVDYIRPNFWNVIYYFNDTDGDTVIYNERSNSVDQHDFLLSKDVWTIKQRVSPKKGRAVAFKGDLFHSASCPKNKSRLVLNINFSEKCGDEVSQNFLKYN